MFVLEFPSLVLVNESVVSVLKCVWYALEGDDSLILSLCGISSECDYGLVLDHILGNVYSLS